MSVWRATTSNHKRTWIILWRRGTESTKTTDPSLTMSMWLCQVIGHSWRLCILSINVIVIFSGRFNPNPGPNSVTQCKKDSSTNGTRVCSSLVPNNCEGGFRLGGNCNGQQRLDLTRLPQSEFQMGDDQVWGDMSNVSQADQGHCRSVTMIRGSFPSVPSRQIWTCSQIPGKNVTEMQTLVLK